MGLAKAINHKGVTLNYHRFNKVVATPDQGEGKVEGDLVSYVDKSCRDADPCNVLLKHGKQVFTKAEHPSLDLNGDLRAQLYALQKTVEGWEDATDV